MAIGLVTLSVINLFLTVYCAVSVYQIKHSPSMNRAVQMEANQ
jgi:presenilin-like A22 family membrane protease